jgi:serine phosphatase RsbU (regulator of sigma subunit)
MPVGVREYSSDGERGPALGDCLGTQFPSGEYSLAPGDTVLLFSRGAFETRSPQDEPFGRQRLREAAAEAPQDAEACLAMLCDRLKSFESHGSALAQDLTLVVINRSGALAASEPAMVESKGQFA